MRSVKQKKDTKMVQYMIFMRKKVLGPDDKRNNLGRQQMTEIWVEPTDEMEAKAKKCAIKLGEFATWCYSKEEIIRMRNVMCNSEGISQQPKQRVVKKKSEGGSETLQEEAEEKEQEAVEDAHPKQKAKKKPKATAKAKAVNDNKRKHEQKSKKEDDDDGEPEKPPMKKPAAAPPSDIAAADRLQRWGLPTSDSSESG